MNNDQRSQRKKRLIVAADDFGLTEGVNQAIATAYRNGILTTASVIVNGRAFELAVGIVKNNPGLDVGLHLNLTEGLSTADPTGIPSLANLSGFLYDHPLKLAAALFRGRVRSADLETEIRTQIEKTIGSGLEITHIDGHKHVHVIPQVFQAICHAAPDYGIQAIRSTVERTPRLGSLLFRNRQTWPQILKQYAFAKAATAACVFSRRGQREQVLITPTRFYGISQTGFLDLETFSDVLHDLNGGIAEIMCHPGYLDDDLKSTPTRLRFQRERELEMLTGREVRDLIKRLGIALVSYKDLLEDYGT
jgi:hopanoid biosynthesis associated protein HpnK